MGSVTSSTAGNNAYSNYYRDNYTGPNVSGISGVRRDINFQNYLNPNKSLSDAILSQGQELMKVARNYGYDETHPTLAYRIQILTNQLFDWIPAGDITKANWKIGIVTDPVLNDQDTFYVYNLLWNYFRRKIALANYIQAHIDTQCGEKAQEYIDQIPYFIQSGIIQNIQQAEYVVTNFERIQRDYFSLLYRVLEDLTKNIPLNDVIALENSIPNKIKDFEILCCSATADILQIFWTQYTDTQTGAPYYYNNITEETQWDYPQPNYGSCQRDIQNTYSPYVERIAPLSQEWAPNPRLSGSNTLKENSENLPTQLQQQQRNINPVTNPPLQVYNPPPVTYNPSPPPQQQQPIQNQPNIGFLQQPEQQENFPQPLSYNTGTNPSTSGFLRPGIYAHNIQ